MTKNKDDILIKCIRSIEPDRPASNFTELVMDDIKAEILNEVVINPSLKSLLQQTGVEKPNANFTHRVMTQIEVIDHKNAYQPIISKKAWYQIAAAAAVLIVSLGFSGQASESPQIVTRYFIGVGNGVSSIFSGIYTVPSVYLLTVIAISVLLLIDYFVRDKIFGQGRGYSH